MPAAADLPRGLTRTSDDRPGIRRRRRGRGFSYHDEVAGRRVTDPDALRRIRGLVIPPGYQSVWICHQPDGHLQATGLDDAGRKQYRYHPDFVAARQRAKFDRVIAFAAALPRLRRRVQRHLEQAPFGSRTFACATAARLLDLTLIRAGHGGSTAGRPTYGLATLRNHHVELEHEDHTVRLSFRGKSGRIQEREIESPELCAALERFRGLRGHRLLQYRGPGGRGWSPLAAADVNRFLKDAAQPASGGPVVATAKDFRTWGATVYAAAWLARHHPNAPAPAAAGRVITAAVKETAATLGHRPATCRNYYLHPAVIRAFKRGRLAEQMNPRPWPGRPGGRTGLNAEERHVLALLQRG